MINIGNSYIETKQRMIYSSARNQLLTSLELREPREIKNSNFNEDWHKQKGNKYMNLEIFTAKKQFEKMKSPYKNKKNFHLFSIYLVNEMKYRKIFTHNLYT